MSSPKKSVSDAPKIDYPHEQLKKMNKEQLIKIVLDAQSVTAQLKKELENVNAILKSLSSDVEVLKKGSQQATPDAALIKRIERNERESYATQQYSRRDCVEIVGIPQSITDEDLETKSLELLNAIGVKLDASQVQACHRLKKKAKTIIKFTNRKMAIECLKNRSKLKDMDTSSFFGASSIPIKIFINESLCPKYNFLFGKLNALYKEKKIKNVWTYNGSVKVRKLDDQIFSIGHENDIAALNII